MEKRKPKTGKIIIIAVVIIAVVAACVIGFAMAMLYGVPLTHHGMRYVDKYAESVYFSQSDLGEYEDIDFTARDEVGLFPAVSTMYTVKYSDEQYAEQLAKLNGLDYLGAPVQYAGRYTMPATKIEQNGWLVRVLQAEGDFEYPKYFKMIGTNDESKTILYMSFDCMDLDLISETAGETQLRDFIEEYFNFNFR